MPALCHLTPSSSTLQGSWMEPGRGTEPAGRKEGAEGRSSTSSTSGKAPCTPSLFDPIPVLLHANTTLPIVSFLKKCRNLAGFTWKWLIFPETQSWSLSGIMLKIIPVCFFLCFLMMEEKKTNHQETQSTADGTPESIFPPHLKRGARSNTVSRTAC